MKHDPRLSVIPIRSRSMMTREGAVIMAIIAVVCMSP